MLFWIVIFIISLAVLVKGADWLLVSAEKIGLSLGLSPFIVGVTIVAMGTSLPELISSLVATFKGVTEIVVANAAGSNIANILLVVGISAILARRLSASKSLIDLDAPLLAISTVLVLGILMDRQVVFVEALLLVITYGIYLAYTVIHREDEDTGEAKRFLPSRLIRRKHILSLFPFKKIIDRPKITKKDLLFLAIGVICLYFGARYLIESIIKLSAILNIAAGVISITAVAIGTSLPELIVSAKAAWQKKSEIALGNIFGSNVFNILMVIGLPGLFRTLVVDEKTFLIGLPFLAVITLLFVISVISRRIHAWEGAMYLVVYLFFIGKLFGII